MVGLCLREITILETGELPILVEYIIRAGHAAPSADNTQPWRFSWDGAALSVSFDEARCGGGLFKASSPAVLLAMGAVIENMVLASSLVNSTVNWSFPVYKENTSELAVAKISDPLSGINEDAWQHGLFARHTNRLAYRKKRIPIEQLSGLLPEPEQDICMKIFDSKDELHELAQLVKMASSMRFRISEVHEWFAGTLRFTPSQVAQGDGLDVNTFPLPPGGRALLRYTSSWRRMSMLNCLNVYKVFAAIESQPIEAGTLILAITSPDTAKSQFNAGRLMERVWCDLNASGFAVQPYYVVADQITRYLGGALPPELDEIACKLLARTKSVLDKDGHKLQMLLRVGYAQQPAIKSRRLDISKVLTVS